MDVDAIRGKCYNYTKPGRMAARRPSGKGRGKGGTARTPKEESRRRTPRAKFGRPTLGHHLTIAGFFERPLARDPVRRHPGHTPGPSRPASGSSTARPSRPSPCALRP